MFFYTVRTQYSYHESTKTYQNELCALFITFCSLHNPRKVTVMNEWLIYTLYFPNVAIVLTKITI